MKTYLEQASDIVTAMVNKGYLRVAIDKNQNWKDYNKASVHTIGWAILEMMYELKENTEKIKQPRKKHTPQAKSNVKPVK